ncbi:Holliday junction resolvase RusA-like endonuclease [Brevundimonas nasdae]|jgi:crossover junction endodeoxyribonuclease RusA|uniref:RusA family crossover junction endodeoxyribonuclease n=1 Tax=Brevundimonas nasdae TaxID=172043 RepID=A0ABX8TLK8_9CAUL|nr:RusA family crossover junction endodeoxyribonuclease [Brevundimonas nasdae]MBK6026647.1 RusA family crossover junction endodeoxyribonuclease [Brevundimonas nasdae]MDQ0453259.1 Holliday junction resolvase RusA-like endonuclease [Brevundimonas nasdae]QYC11529.1 RusA family crossover junction endodeoxyribonuclease [Brevundimonas nasdae]QYC14317.1 RusA family crossover junction endodeoxyribonuclease [Brevundimonas nasdae]
MQGKTNGDWIGTGKVRAREDGDAVEIVIDGLTTQAKYYKPLVYEFMRKEWSSRPSWGDHVVEIRMEHVGDPPWMDLDNLAKALLDSIKGYLFHDDSQVARLVVERNEGEKERITIRSYPRVR